MNKTVVIDVVGLSSSIIGEYTPFLKEYIAKNHVGFIRPMLPALTTAVQSTFLTGKLPEEHGIVGNGWYDREDCEVKFWKQSNKLVQGEKIWEKAKRQDPLFTCSQLFGWYNMYSEVDFSVTPRPNYLADGRKIPDCYSHPAELRDYLQQELGQFPLFQFWGPNANVKSTQWIADAAILTDERYDPTLSFIYLPHLDYCLQKVGPYVDAISKELKEIDAIVKQLVGYYEKKNTRILLLSEYGISPVNNPIHINRLLRENGLLQVRVERGLELLDPGASKAFAVADHQIAHVYVNDKAVEQEVRALLENIAGIELVLDREQQVTHHIQHERAGDFVVVADQQSWFTYYFWLDNEKAPDYARVVDIHKKPGYDPVELFMTSKWRAAYKLLRKKLGLRYVLDVIPLNADLVRGSHGCANVSKEYYPVIISHPDLNNCSQIEATDVFNIIWNCLFQ
ncbi:alkaline phosphatase family protein [Olivibacter domesticus]|uniref:Predicted pyrophosphatase or phosphodiesterase, AlkP superfamily n=1 Tax=Olivibacter domesticus TaxID=407022 RepID=A0A1H7XWR6_OLID1|nr:nucleotide pyrophosphatase/phosphodiesterase family protein [Olivibacter domesticus]SEM38143.1 Predicted pyrophosphatase or phosphodiesterase, AlkP superfamily [Olivibacter domesticus]